MSELDTGIEKKTIAFYPTETTAPKTIEIKFILSSSAFKLQVLIFNHGNAEMFLHFLHQFNEAKSKLGYNTCPKLESGLEQLLQGNTKNEWNTIKSTVALGSQNVNALNERWNDDQNYH